MARSIDDIVREVEGADIAGLGRVDIDDVYQQMDHLLQSRPTPLDLYDRWEKQNWAVQDLDFSEDVEHWKNLFEPIRDLLQNTMTLFFLGEQAVTDTLSPLVHAAPSEEDRIFLSTQLVDEARHARFFQRFFDEVMGVSGGLGGALQAVRPEAVSGWRKIFDHELVEATERVREHPTDYAAWVRGITTYHLVVEGMLALTGQKFMLRTIRNVGILPGFYAGFTAVTRDESRHVNYGVGAMQHAVVKGMAKDIEEQIMKLLEPSCWTIFAPDRKIPIADPSVVPEELRTDPREIQDFSLFSLTKRLKVLGLSQEFCERVTETGKGYYEACVAEYEDKHGEDHPIRWWERNAS